jgi:hypothetical protein
MFSLEAGGRSSWWRASTLIADHFEKRPDGVRAALGFHLAVYSALGACFAFSLYALLHPSQVSSSSLAAHQVLPAAVLANDAPQASGAASPIATAVDPGPRTRTVATAPPALALPPEPMPEPEVGPETALTPPPALKPAAPPSQRRTNKKPSREVRVGTSNRRGAPCIPAYDSSGAQTRPCG